MASQRAPYDIIGEDHVAALVNSFYDLIETDPAYARLRALHDPDLDPVRHGLTRFLVGWLGGPRDWFSGGKCIMGLHRKFPIDRELADEWSLAMKAAIAVQNWADVRLAEQLGDALGDMADAMINQREGLVAS